MMCWGRTCEHICRRFDTADRRETAEAQAQVQRPSCEGKSFRTEDDKNEKANVCSGMDVNSGIQVGKGRRGRKANDNG